MSDNANKAASLVWLDGVMCRISEAVVPISSHGLNYGTGVFEGIRYYGGRAFLLDEHIARFRRSATAIGLSYSYSDSDLRLAVIKVIREAGYSNGYVRPLLWLGDENLGLRAHGLTTHVGIFAWEWPEVFDKQSGISLHLDSGERPNEMVLPPQSKSTGSYLASFIWHNRAREEGFDDCLLRDFEGYIAETSSSNFFAVIGDKVVTPFADRFLDGLTRQCVIRLAKNAGIQVEEARIRGEDVCKFDEAFVTGTAVEVQPVTQINQKTFEVGPVTIHIRKLYTDHVGV